MRNRVVVLPCSLPDLAQGFLNPTLFHAGRHPRTSTLRGTPTLRAPSGGPTASGKTPRGGGKAREPSTGKSRGEEGARGRRRSAAISRGSCQVLLLSLRSSLPCPRMPPSLSLSLCLALFALSLSLSLSPLSLFLSLSHTHTLIHSLTHTHSHTRALSRCAGGWRGGQIPRAKHRQNPRAEHRQNPRAEHRQYQGEERAEHREQQGGKGAQHGQQGQLVEGQLRAAARCHLHENYHTIGAFV